MARQPLRHLQFIKAVFSELEPDLLKDGSPRPAGHGNETPQEAPINNTHHPSLKQCNACKTFQEHEKYYPDSRFEDGLKPDCRACVMSARRNLTYDSGRELGLNQQRALPRSKRCSRCLEVLPSAKFHANRCSGDGLHNWCKPCVSAQQRSRREKNRAAVMKQLAQDQKACAQCHRMLPLCRYQADRRALGGLHTTCIACSKTASSALAPTAATTPQPPALMQGVPALQMPGRDTAQPCVSTPELPGSSADDSSRCSAFQSWSAPAVLESHRKLPSLHDIAAAAAALTEEEDTASEGEALTPMVAILSPVAAAAKPVAGAPILWLQDSCCDAGSVTPPLPMAARPHRPAMVHPAQQLPAACRPTASTAPQLPNAFLQPPMCNPFAKACAQAAPSPQPTLERALPPRTPSPTTATANSAINPAATAPGQAHPLVRAASLGGGFCIWQTASFPAAAMPATPLHMQRGGTTLQPARQQELFLTHSAPLPPLPVLQGYPVTAPSSMFSADPAAIPTNGLVKCESLATGAAQLQLCSNAWPADAPLKPTAGFALSPAASAVLRLCSGCGQTTVGDARAAAAADCLCDTCKTVGQPGEVQLPATRVVNPTTIRTACPPAAIGSKRKAASMPSGPPPVLQKRAKSAPAAMSLQAVPSALPTRTADSLARMGSHSDAVQVQTLNQRVLAQLGSHDNAVRASKLLLCMRARFHLLLQALLMQQLLA